MKLHLQIQCTPFDYKSNNYLKFCMVTDSFIEFIFSLHFWIEQTKKRHCAVTIAAALLYTLNSNLVKQSHSDWFEKVSKKLTHEKLTHW